MKLPRRDVREIHIAGLMHDIGKIGVKEAILNKPGQLTSQEFEEIKKHPVVSAQILAPIPEMARVVSYIRSHHEFYNGQGYPDGLQGKEIPLGARIIHVADAYDTMGYDRVYRKAMSEKQLLSEFRRESGREFDPKIVRVFFSLVKEGVVHPDGEPGDG